MNLERLLPYIWGIFQDFSGYGKAFTIYLGYIFLDIQGSGKPFTIYLLYIWLYLGIWKGFYNRCGVYLVIFRDLERLLPYILGIFGYIQGSGKAFTIYLGYIWLYLGIWKGFFHISGVYLVISRDLERLLPYILDIFGYTQGSGKTFTIYLGYIL